MAECQLQYENCGGDLYEITDPDELELIDGVRRYSRAFNRGPDVRRVLNYPDATLVCGECIEDLWLET